MRHNVSGNKLGRNQSLRKATVRDLAIATLKKERICTTKAKAKEARKLVDQLISLGKSGQLAQKREAFSVLLSHQLVSKLFNQTAPRFANRQGGYTRIIPYKFRRGDNAELVFLELTELEKPIITGYKEVKPANEKKAKEPKAAKETKALKEPSKEKSAAEPKKKAAPKAATGVKGVAPKKAAGRGA